MKATKALLAVLGFGFVVVISTVAILRFSGNRGGAVQPGTEGGVAMVTSESVGAISVSTLMIEENIAWVAIALCVVFQLWAWVAAVQKLGKVKQASMSAAARLQRLEAVDVYFDLPLHLGLLGTVLSFILITMYPNARLLFAYASTAMGIVVSLALRLVHLTPYRERLIMSLQPGDQVIISAGQNGNDRAHTHAMRGADEMLK